LKDERSRAELHDLVLTSAVNAVDNLNEHSLARQVSLECLGDSCFVGSADSGCAADMKLDTPVPGLPRLRLDPVRISDLDSVLAGDWIRSGNDHSGPEGLETGRHSGRSDDNVAARAALGAGQSRRGILVLALRAERHRYPVPVQPNDSAFQLRSAPTGSDQAHPRIAWLPRTYDWPRTGQGAPPAGARFDSCKRLLCGTLGAMRPASRVACPTRPL